jgi:hypothetical protein
MAQAHSQGQAKRSAAVAGIGAALVAAAITATMVMSNPSPAAMPAQPAAPTNQCQKAPIMLLVSTTTGGGTIRFREGSYLSPPITLSSVPQAVVFPRLRSETAPIEEVIVIEGNATDIVTFSPVTRRRTVFPNVTGLLAYKETWVPVKPC